MLEIIGSIVLFLLVCYGIWTLRKRFPVIDRHWKDGYIWTFIAIVLIHLGIWWQWPHFWKEWHVQSGFLFFQILLGIGLYLRLGLKDKKFLKHMALVIVILGVIGIGWNVWVAFHINRSASELMSPVALSNIPPQNKRMEEEVTKFWKKHLPEQSALAMLRIIRRQSGFNQFASDGKTPYRNKTSDYKKVGVMQIDDALWLERATELDYNLYELKGNMRFGLWLYEHEGFAPWESNQTSPTLSLAKFSLFKSSRPVNNQPFQSGNQEGKFSSNLESDIPAGADPEVVSAVNEKFKDYPFLKVVARFESGFRQWKSTTDHSPANLLHAHLENGGEGEAIGVLQIKPSVHRQFCLQHGVDINTIVGNLDCGILILEDPSRGPDAWNPEDGGLREFDQLADVNLTKPLLIPQHLKGFRFNIACSNNMLAKINDNPNLIPCGPTNPPKDPNKKRIEVGNTIQTISFQAETGTALAHITFSYPPIKRKG